MKWNTILKRTDISDFENKIRSQAIPIEELDDKRIRCTICKGSPDYETPILSGGKKTYLCDKCLSKALDKHMKNKEQKERDSNDK